MKPTMLLGFHLVMMFTVLVSAATNNDCKSPFYFGRNPTDCSKWFRCVFGVPYPMIACSRGMLFSLKSHSCVVKGSIYDDCPSGKSAAINSCTVSSPNAVFSKSDNCAQFYNCSLPRRSPRPGYLGDHVDECPYPQLFSETTNRCENFENVDCGGRKEIVYACDYERLKCAVAHCRPCQFTHPDCRGFSNGANVWKERIGTPFYAHCYKGRGFAQTCRRQNGQIRIFSADARRCEPPRNIPK